MSQPTSLRVGQTDDGYIVRVEGRGTMRESPAAEVFARQALREEPARTVIFDLQACSYLDSTFLGCLITLHKEFKGLHPPRFFVAAPAECRTRLLAPTFLDRYLNLLESPPATPDD